MDELIKEALNEYFSDFKEYHLIILIAFTIIIALIQVIQSILVSKKLEKFKNELKKSEIRFSRHNELQVSSLSKIYPILVLSTLHTLLIKDEVGKPFEKRNPIAITDWEDSFNEIFNNYTQDAYIIPKSLKPKFSLVIRDMIKINSYLTIEDELNESTVTIQGQRHYFGEEENRKKLNSDLDKIKDDEVFEVTIKNLNGLKSDIEKYFEDI